MMQMIVGRERECKELQQCIDSTESEFVVVYGRRRVGKTYLVDRYLSSILDFKYVGGHNLRTREQLNNFAKALKEFSGQKYEPFLDWFEAFDALKSYLATLPKQRKIIFIDEMPWMDSRRSNFVTALEVFWNGWAIGQGNIVLVATGSATSWMVDKLLKNRGGLHNRIRTRIHLKPFTLKETEQYLQQRNAVWDRYEILQCYMLTGGVPYYLRLIDPKLSITQNINQLCFTENGALADEFKELYHAIFPGADSYTAIVRLLAQHKSGLTRQEISEKTRLSGRFLTQVLSNLERCDFVGVRNQFGNKKSDAVYRLIDFYSLFYFQFLEGQRSFDNDWWLHHLESPSIHAWQGLTFELICMEHHQQIKNALGISGMATKVSTWRVFPDKRKELPGGQIDMLIERADRRIHICEMKFSTSAYNLTPKYENELRERMWLFNTRTGNKKPIVHTFVTTFGIGVGKLHSLVHSEITIDDLFNT